MTTSRNNFNRYLLPPAVWCAALAAVFLLTCSARGVRAQTAAGSGQDSALQEYDILVEDALDTIERVTSDVPEPVTLRRAGTSEDADRAPPSSLVIDEIEATNEDIHDVLKEIAAESGLNIVVGQNIRARVTIYLKDVFVWDALRIILDTNGLAYVKDGDIVRVITAEEYERQFGHPFGKKMQTKMIPLLYAEAKDLINVLEEMKSSNGKVIYNDQTNTFVLIDAPQYLTAMSDFVKTMDVPIETEAMPLEYASARWVAEKVTPVLSKGVGKVIVKTADNSVVVTDTPSKIKQARELVKRLDQPEREVLLQAKVIQIVLNDEHMQGVDWEAIVSDYQSLKFEGLKNSITAGPEGALSLGTISDEDLVVLLDALDTVGQIYNIEETSMAAFKNEPAGIRVESIKDINLADEEEDDNLQMGDEDVRFYVTLQGRNEAGYELHIQPEVFGLAENDTVTEVEDGETIVIGGLFRDVDVEVTRKIPILGDLPFLGFAFRKGGQRTRPSEIIIFLTPRMLVNE